MRTVLVTGASRGIGRAIALTLAGAGFDIVIHCRSSRGEADTLKEEIEKIGRQARLLMFDVADRKAASEFIETDIETHGAYYGVVCNAGIHIDGAFPTLTGEDWDQVINTNLNGFFNVVNPLIMPMVRLRDGGRIVVMSSVSGMMGNRGQVNYSAAKAGLMGATKALAIELAKRKITVNCVAPGIIATAMTEQLDNGLISQMVPLQRAGTPDEVASLVGYLFSDAAAYITRQVISVNGGMF